MWSNQSIQQVSSMGSWYPWVTGIDINTRIDIFPSGVTRGIYLLDSISYLTYLKKGFDTHITIIIIFFYFGKSLLDHHGQTYKMYQCHDVQHGTCNYQYLKNIYMWLKWSIVYITNSYHRLRLNWVYR